MSNSGIFYDKTASIVIIYCGYEEKSVCTPPSEKPILVIVDFKCQVQTNIWVGVYNIVQGTATALPKIMNRRSVLSYDILYLFSCSRWKLIMNKAEPIGQLLLPTSSSQYNNEFQSNK